uniref:Uncharacterized protein n=1 Tax=Panagrolaimus sp. JU765 TaxID=591449 RepID=A0AC34QUS8_9BILA
MVRLDFGIYKNPFAPRTDDQVVMSVFDGTRVRPLYSNLHFTEPNIFRLTLYFCTGRILDVENVERYGGEIYDSNFPCTDASDELLKSWAHNGRQIMYSVYFDETVEDMAYVFVNINDVICEYHIKYDEIKKGSESKPHAVRFDRFKGLRLTAPPGYKVVHPFMSVDTAMRTYNYLVVNLKGPIEVKMMSYRFYSDGPKKPLRWEEYNVTNDLLPRYQYQNCSPW